jgi:CO/xanthine dehydrogenase FAD-binding subunit
MIPPSFDYHAPATLPDALKLLAQHGDDAKVLSGRQSLLPLLKMRLAAPAHVVDIGRIPPAAFNHKFVHAGPIERDVILSAYLRLEVVRIQDRVL